MRCNKPDNDITIVLNTASDDINIIKTTFIKKTQIF